MEKLMLRLLVQQTEAQYVGAFARPPFSLWGDGRALLEGLHDAFAGFQVSLKDFRVEGTPDDPSSQTVKVYIGAHGQYRFRFDRVEATLTNGSLDELRLLPSLLANGSSWLREIVEGFTFQSHLLSYGVHCSLSEGTSETYLSNLATPALSTLGTARGNGVIFHADRDERSWRLQLTVDHSLLIEHGLFIQFVILSMSDALDYESLFDEVQNSLGASLAALGLSFDD
jgi:hypothetical protein